MGILALAGRRFMGLAPALRDGENFGLLLLALMLTGIALGTAAWARSVFAGGREAGLAPPGDRTAPPPAGWSLLLGLFFPGLGLHLDHRPGRAALAVAAVGASAAGCIVLVFAAPLWTWNHRSPLGGVPEDTLEFVYLAAAGLCVLGGLAWLIQALDGMRLSGPPARSGPATRGDGYGLALLLALVVLAAGFRPGLWAAELDARAEWAHGKGLRWTPVAMSEAARRLDPTRPDYALRAAALHDELGNEAAATSIRAGLGRTWNLYVAGTWVRRPQAPVENPCVPGN